MHLNISSGKWWPFCLCLNVLKLFGCCWCQRHVVPAVILPTGNRGLTHWGPNKMADIIQTTFRMHFLQRKLFKRGLIGRYSQGSDWQWYSGWSHQTTLKALPMLTEIYDASTLAINVLKFYRERNIHLRFMSFLYNDMTQAFEILP